MTANEHLTGPLAAEEREMKLASLSKHFSVRRVARALALTVAVGSGVFFVALAWGYVDRTWLAPRRWAHILATLNEKTQTVDQQLTIIGKAISAHPRNDYAWYLRARKLTEKKEYREAARGWAGLEGKFTGALNDLYRADLGMCLMFDGRPVEATSCFHEAIFRRPEHVSSRVFLAAAYADLGMPRKVRDELLILDRLKDNWRAWFGSVPEWPDELRAALAKLSPYLHAPPPPNM